MPCISSAASQSGKPDPLLPMQTIEARTAYLKPLAALAGRLDLLTAHLPKQHESSAAPDPLALPVPQVRSISVHSAK